MIVVDIAHNSNCPQADLRVFHDLGPAKAVTAVRLEQEHGSPAWYAVTGWAANGAEGQPCHAYAQKVDDSGDGTAFLLYGGDAGVRLRPVGDSGPWRLDDARQWGEPFLIIGEVGDLKE